MVMTMPSLNNFQIKRPEIKYTMSMFNILLPAYMIYENVHSTYDTICAAGPHHVKEIKAIEAKYGLPSKNVVKLGYSRLDSLIEKANSNIRNISAKKHKQKKF